jgi:hypothetical protein
VKSSFLFFFLLYFSYRLPPPVTPLPRAVVRSSALHLCRECPVLEELGDGFIEPQRHPFDRDTAGEVSVLVLDSGKGMLLLGFRIVGLSTRCTISTKAADNLNGLPAPSALMIK